MPPVPPAVGAVAPGTQRGSPASNAAVCPVFPERFATAHTSHGHPTARRCQWLSVGSRSADRRPPDTGRRTKQLGPARELVPSEPDRRQAPAEVAAEGSAHGRGRAAGPAGASARPAGGRADAASAHARHGRFGGVLLQSQCPALHEDHGHGDDRVDARDGHLDAGPLPPGQPGADGRHAPRLSALSVADTSYGPGDRAVPARRPVLPASFAGATVGAGRRGQPRLGTPHQ